MGIVAPVLPEGAPWRRPLLSTFVSVGNATQPFDRLLNAVCKNATCMPAPIVIQFGNTTFNCDGTECKGFVSMDEFERMVEEASLVVMHAGAGSVIHAVRAGKVPVVMPRRARYGEHVDDHQLEFARHLARIGLVALAEEPENLPAAVESASSLQATRQARSQPALMLELVGEALRKYAARGNA